MPKVMIHPADYESVRPAIDRSFDLFPMTLAGKRVLIKPNMLRSSEAGEGIVTHPAVLAAVVAKVKSYQPAQIIVGDNPGLPLRCFSMPRGPGCKSAAEKGDPDRRVTAGNVIMNLENDACGRPNWLFGGWETGKPSSMADLKRKTGKQRPECVHGRVDRNG